MLRKTIRIQRPTERKSDARGRNVWQGPIETVELELVSTTMLPKILASDDAKQDIQAAALEDSGVLAHDVENDRYEIVDAEGHDEFSLVSTQMLQRILRKDTSDVSDELADVEVQQGFDPYNSR